MKFKDITVFYEYSNGTGSAISEGNIRIVAAVGAVAVIAIAAVVVAKKKILLPQPNKLPDLSTGQIRQFSCF